jgi:hypothetical protein
MMISAILKISQLIMILVIHSIFKPVPINKKKVKTHAAKAINNLFAAGMRLKRFVVVLFFSNANRFHPLVSIQKIRNKNFQY